LEILGNETEVNGIHYEPVVLIKLKHRDVILVGGRKLRFEYLPPDYKPISSNFLMCFNMYCIAQMYLFSTRQSS
jgi:hypothetical protein